jgi:transposase
MKIECCVKMRWRRREEMSIQRKRSSAEFKARVALDAVKGLKTVNEWASTYGVHPTQITHWNQQLQKEVPDIFSARRAKREHDHEAFQAQWSQQIGQLKVELDWLKKKAGLATWGQAGVDRTGASADQHGTAGRPGRVATVNLLLSGAGGEGRKSLFDAVTGEAIPRHAVLWRASDDRLVTEARVGSES